MLDEGGLQGVETVDLTVAGRGGQPLDRRDFTAAEEGGQLEAGVGVAAVYVDGACPAGAVIAALACAVEVAFVTEEVQEGAARINAGGDGLAVEDEVDVSVLDAF